MPHGRREGPAAALVARVFPARRRPESSDHLRGRPHPGRQELHHAHGQGDPAWPGDLLDVGVVPCRGRGLHAPVENAGRADAREAQERRRGSQEPIRDHARAGAALLRARAADRAAPRRVRALPRQEDRRRPLQHLDPLHQPPARRPGDPSMRARLCVRHGAARRFAHPARPQRVRQAHHGGIARPRALVPPSVPRRRVVALLPGKPECLGSMRLFARADLRDRRHPGRVGGAGRAPAHSCQTTRPLYAVARTISPKAIRYHANGTKVCVDT